MGERACEVKSWNWIGNGFRAWCGRKYETSRPTESGARDCEDCTKAMKKAGKL